MNWLHFLAMQHYIPKYQVAGSGVAVETWCFACSSFVICGYPFACCSQRVVLPGEHTLRSGSLLRPGRAAWQSWHCKEKHRVILWMPKKNLRYFEGSANLGIKSASSAAREKTAGSLETRQWGVSLSWKGSEDVEVAVGKPCNHHVSRTCAPLGCRPGKVLPWGTWKGRVKAGTYRVPTKIWSSRESRARVSPTLLLGRSDLVLRPS